MNIIIQTDYNQDNLNLVIMKGIIKSINSSINIIDGPQNIERHAIYEASLSIRRMSPYYPKDTVIINTISDNQKHEYVVAYTKSGQYIITSNNGSLTHMKKHIQEVRQISRNYAYREEDCFNDKRDMFANIGGLLVSKQITFEEVGEILPLDKIYIDKQYYREIYLEKHYIQSSIMHINEYDGSIEIQVRNDMMHNCDFDYGDCLLVSIDDNQKKQEIKMIYDKEKTHKNYEILAYPGSHGYITIYQKNERFYQDYHLEKGRMYHVSIKKI